MKYSIAFVFWLTAYLAVAQLQVKPLQTNNAPAKYAARQQAYTITLPFWDDFSTSTGKVDTTWWLPGSQVQVISKAGIGIDPPTLNVATFDGVDAFGTPYLNTDTDGNVDSLVSQPIDLTQVPSGLRNTVYISFFYQTKGLGEAPEEEDSLILYMKDVDGLWNKVWPINSADNYNTNPDVFTERFIQVNDPKYFHEGFQFMFKAKGRQNGWFDNWLLDYVYMDKRRSTTDNSYLDRAFISSPSSIFDQYTAILFDDFVATVDKNNLFQSVNVKIRNLENDYGPILYSVKLYDTLNNALIETIENQVPKVLTSKQLFDTTAVALNSALLDPSADSLFLMLEYYINSGDTFLIDSTTITSTDTIVYYSNVDLRVNDTTRAYFNLYDYYAYDDGTAEYGAGINQPQGKVAYQYQVVVGKYLDRIDIYFPNIDGNQTGTPLELFALKDFDETNNSLLASSSIAISHTGINKFVHYNVSPPVYVSDTFFIGFTNLSSSDNWVGVGLDKNTDSYDKIFVNVDGNWVPNTNIHGSLMMRPHFTDQPPVTGIEDLEQNPIDVYPNPSYGSLKIVGNYTSLRLIDLWGREVPVETSGGGSIKYHVGSTQLLFLVVETPEGIYTKRVFANPANR